MEKVIILIFSLFFVSCGKYAEAQTGQNRDYYSGGSFTHIGRADTVMRVINHPAFKGFGQFIFPTDSGLPGDTMRLDNINSLLPYHSTINADTTVSVINYLIDEVNEGKTVFYDFYTAQQKQADPAKNATGIFFFKGKPGAPFAVVCPGGGFSYVGSIHEGFPLALELSKKGYNTFSIKYRVGGERRATEDLAAAISFIIDNAQVLEVSVQNYSLWGGSAGARMAANIGSNGTAAYGGGVLPQPCVVVMQYTGHSAYTVNDPPTYALIGANDGIASPAVMERRITNLRNAGIDAEFHLYRNIGHGFGLGIGTSAEGWQNSAVRFWEKHQK